LMNGLARVPNKGVASCDKPRVGASSLRSGDSLMGLPIISSQELVMFLYGTGTLRTEAS